MIRSRHVITYGLGFILALSALPALAQDKISSKINVVASFSILGDLVTNVGGDRVAVTTLVGPNGDGHTFQPSPRDARTVAEARIIFVNGLGFEGWMPRLIKASGGSAETVVVTDGIAPRTMKEEDDAQPGSGHEVTDPHAWQSVANTKQMVRNIRNGLVAADPAGKDAYKANAAAYLEKLDNLEADVKSAIASIPPERRRIITSHDAFGYFGATYGMEFIAPQGVSTEAEASAKAVARIIRQIRKEKIPAVFIENISDARLVKRIADETGAKIGGTLYSDALSKPEDGAGTYIDMIRHNIREFVGALAS
jgi:zinc/manganese transport system substrate-binding protein